MIGVGNGNGSACTTVFALACALSSLGCPAPETEHDIEALQDPDTCESCHPDHHRQWLGSMHAYAADDPVFRAMNARGQRETNGELGDFCVRCHAPVAVALGLTQDGLNLDEVPLKYRGVTCYACHQITAVEGTHNAPVVFALDTIMRGGLVDPDEPPDHGAVKSDLLDGDRLASSGVCGSCHDIVTPDGAAIERTYAEWQASFYSHANPDELEKPAIYGLTCIDCHMRRSTGPAADFPGVRGDRDVHAHTFVGVDVAVTDFPDATLGPQLRAEQREAIADVRKTALCASLCVDEGDAGEANVTVWLHNEAAGHSWPSGATPDRRAWVELIARDADDVALLESGIVADDQPITALEDPNLWLFHDRLFDGEGQPTHMFWEAASYESDLLPVADVFGGAGHEQTWMSRVYVLDAETLAGEPLPARVDMRVRLRPIGLEILAELVDSGDLDPAIVDVFETFDVPPAALQWTLEEAEPSDDYGTCISSSPGCGSPFL